MSQLVRVAWAPIAVVVAHSALAALIGHRRDLDPLFHFTGGVAGAHAILQGVVLFPQWVPRVAIGHVNQFVLATMTAVAVLWELAEFVSDQFLRSRIQLGWTDTGMDLVLGVGGAVVGVIVLGVFVRKESRAG